MNLRIGVLAVAIVTMLPHWAYAQFSPNTGFPVGEKSRIHTGLDIGVGLDYNSKRFDTDTGDLDGPRDDFRTVIRPQLVVDVPGSSVKFKLKTQLSLTQFLNNGEARFNQTLVGGDVVAGLTLGSEDSLVGFSLDNQLVRTPVVLDEVGTVASDERRFPLWHNRGTARLTLRPGGRALELDIGGTVQLTLYDEETGLPFGTQFGGLFEARWRFFPKTALVFHADISSFNASRDDAGTTVTSTPLHVTIGARGQITSKLTAEAAVGYGSTLSSSPTGSSLDASTGGLIATAVIGYQANDVTRIRLGYRRSIEPVIILNSYSSDAPFVEFSTGLLNQLTLKAYAEYDFRSYANSARDTQTDRRSVQLASADVRVEYWFFEYLNASVMYRLQLQNPDAPEATTNVLLQDFARHQLMFNVGLRY